MDAEAPSGGWLERYSRQLPVIGVEGQRRLAGARVAVVGLGGLGSAVSLYLAAAGVGELILVDSDAVEVHNLNRQVLYGDADVGLPKAYLAARRVRLLNGGVRVRAVHARVEEALDEVVEADVVVDCLDNWAARVRLDEAAWRAGVPLVHGAVESWYGQVTVVKRGVTTCLRCIAPRAERRGPIPVLGPTPGVVGLIQALEVVKIVTGAAEPLYNKLLVVDLKSYSMDVVRLEPVDCGACRG